MQTTTSASRTPAFQRVKKATAAQGIVDQFKALMRNKHYVCGSKLPSEQDLAAELGVSRPTVREAQQTLSLFGVLDTRHGSGTRVAESVEGILKVPFEFLVLLDRPSVNELHETRTLLEVFLAGQAALRRTDKDLGAIEAALRDIRTALDNSLADSIDPDMRFHEAVAAASGNRILARVLVGLRHGIRHCMDATVATAEAHPDELEACFRTHEQVLAAIKRKNPKAARAAMTRHMDITAAQLEGAGLLDR